MKLSQVLGYTLLLLAAINLTWMLSVWTWYHGWDTLMATIMIPYHVIIFFMGMCHNVANELINQKAAAMACDLVGLYTSLGYSGGIFLMWAIPALLIATICASPTDRNNPDYPPDKIGMFLFAVGVVLATLSMIWWVFWWIWYQSINFIIQLIQNMPLFFEQFYVNLYKLLVFLEEQLGITFMYLQRFLERQYHWVVANNPVGIWASFCLIIILALFGLNMTTP